MPILSDSRIAGLLSPFLAGIPVPPADLYAQLGLYLDLLLKWNARTNLTAIREPELIVTRHFGESLFAATRIPSGVQTVLDLGSGAGFPGLPLQLLRPDLTVTLAESQGKKAAFLREVIRTLRLPTLVHAARAEDLIGVRMFDLVTLRAVDNPTAAIATARQLTSAPLLLLTTAADSPPGTRPIPVPGSRTQTVTFL